MEILGAGIGTLISRIAMVYIIFWFMKNNQKFMPFLSGANLKNISKNIWLKIMNLGIPTTMQMFF